MRVGIDYWPATTHAPGVGRYARELVRALAGLPGDHELSLLEIGAGRPTVSDLGLSAARIPIRRRRARLPRRLLRTAWFPAADTLAGGVDLFHHIVPGAARIRRARQTVTLSEIPAPGSAAVATLARFLRPMDAVLVFGAAASTEAASLLDVSTDQLHVVPVGCDHWVRNAEPQPLPDAPPTLLVLGSPRASRRPETIIAAWDLLREGGVECRLRFVGGPAPTGSSFDRLVASRSHVTHDLPDETQLAGVVAGAAVLVHLNESEATAVTPLEAFSFGLAVVASDLPAFRETLDEEAHLMDTEAVVDDPRLLADALAQALTDAGNDRLRARRRAIAERFTWSKNALATLSVWRDLLNE